MDFEFADRELRRLYEEGRSRKHKLPKYLVRKFIMRIDEIEAAETIHDLWCKPSLNFEKMTGYANRYSIRAQDKWRVEFEIDWKDEKRTRGLFRIMKYSKHYGE